MVNQIGENSNPSAKTLRRLRIALGWTQKEMAEVFGVTERTIQRYEDGSREIRLNLWQMKIFLALMQQAHLSPDILPDRPS